MKYRKMIMTIFIDEELHILFVTEYT